MEPAVIRMMCPNLKCLRILTVPVNARGKTVRCRGCGSNVRVPDGSAGEPAPIGGGSDKEPSDTVV